MVFIMRIVFLYSAPAVLCFVPFEEEMKHCRPHTTENYLSVHTDIRQHLSAVQLLFGNAKLSHRCRSRRCTRCLLLGNVVHKTMTLLSLSHLRTFDHFAASVSKLLSHLLPLRSFSEPILMQALHSNLRLLSGILLPGTHRSATMITHACDDVCTIICYGGAH